MRNSQNGNCCFHATGEKQLYLGSIETVFYLKPLEIFFTLIVIMARKKILTAAFCKD